jgi:diguanylate cyclase (GGDEF) domain
MKAGVENKKMKKRIPKLYAVCAAAVVLLFLYICAVCGNVVVEKREKGGYICLTEYESQRVKDQSAPAGIRNEYVLRIGEVPKDNTSLVFYTLHQEVEVFVEGELVYQLRPFPKNPFGRTPGSNWNWLPVYQSDAGKEIRIVLTPAYENTADIVPEFYLGSRIDIWGKLLMRSTLPFLMSVTAMIIGLGFVVFTLYNYHNPDADRSLLMLGIFSFVIGMWKLSDMEAMVLACPFSLPLAYLPFVMLLLTVVPFVQYVRELFSTKGSVLWDIPCVASMVVMGLSVVLQIFGIADLRQTVWMLHIVMVGLVAVMVGMLAYELRKVGWNSRLKVLVVCLTFCMAGYIVDVAVYYMSNGASMMVLGMCGFLIYIVVLGIRSVQDMRKLINIGIQARHYEQMAYHDQLTGLYNRTAYAADTGVEDFSPEQYIVVMFDLNDLKKCNDTRGHEKGDRYIVTSAKMIQDTFGDLGKCYRMGGDEFCVLLKSVTLSECKKRVQHLKEIVDRCNRREPEEFPIRIACGYELYDKRIDYDLGDTLRRADKMMYHEKFMMKQEVLKQQG